MATENDYSPLRDNELQSLHPSVKSLLRFFRYEHLPNHLQQMSRPFSRLANLVARSGKNQEATVALRKLLEAKDAAVRSVL